MIQNAIYFGKSDIYHVIKAVGGSWTDQKERPIVCMIKSTEHEDLYWAIPVGMYNHRDEQAKQRLERYINYPQRDIRSCFYHIGKTTTKSIFFISDTIPITDKYIDREYLGYDNSQFIIKNNNLITELQRKLKRILYYENVKPNYFRQRITDSKNFLLQELNTTVTIHKKSTNILITD